MSLETRVEALPDDEYRFIDGDWYVRSAIVREMEDLWAARQKIRVEETRAGEVNER